MISIGLSLIYDVTGTPPVAGCLQWLLPCDVHWWDERKGPGPHTSARCLCCWPTVCSDIYIHRWVPLSLSLTYTLVGASVIISDIYTGGCLCCLLWHIHWWVPLSLSLTYTLVGASVAISDIYTGRCLCCLLWYIPGASVVCSDLYASCLLKYIYHQCELCYRIKFWFVRGNWLVW